MSPRTWALVLAMSLLAAGCGAFTGTDAGDGGAGDAGLLTDGGASDGGGTVTDAGTPDAGSPDAGTVDAGTPDAGPPDAGPPDAGPDGGLPGTATLTVGNWNLDWFGSTQYGPTDLALQEQNVDTVLQRHPASLWALQEVVDVNRLARVAQTLGGLGHLAAGDNQVLNHGDYRGTQQTAILYDPAVITVRSAQVVLGADYYDFAQRPPFVVAVDVHTPGGVLPMTVVVVHMKAYADATSYARRQAASRELKTWLDQTHPSDPVLVLGDWNDDLDTSDYASSASPYVNFVSDTADYTFPTLIFTQHSIGTYVGSSDPIDHQMVTNELAPDVVAGSQTVVHPSIPSYRSTTSDHYPVQVTYQLQ